MDRFRLVPFLTVLSLPRSTKRDAIRMSVTLKVILRSASSNFQSLYSGATCTMYGSTCQLLLNKRHNGHLAALFPEVTQIQLSIMHQLPTINSEPESADTAIQDKGTEEKDVKTYKNIYEHLTNSVTNRVASKADKRVLQGILNKFQASSSDSLQLLFLWWLCA